jgi:hypothetical protein
MPNTIGSDNFSFNNEAKDCKTVITFLNFTDAAEIKCKYTGVSNVTDNCNQVENIIFTLKGTPGKPRDLGMLPNLGKSPCPPNNMLNPL